MVNLVVDGVAVQLADGACVVEAAQKAGIEIPTLCHHPDLKATSQCGLCVVEIDGVDDLVSACSTAARDGMHVRTSSPRIREARHGVFEILFATHPLECPVCDQSGECALQELLPHDLTGDDKPRKANSGNAADAPRDLGPRVRQHPGRCVECSLCVRLFDEIFETQDLVVTENRTEASIHTVDGGPFDNEWSVCASDICPVGALTERAFRFRQPVWRLQTTDSICPGCSIGCNIEANHRDGVVYRFKPRHNREINGSWMCDDGRCLADDLNNRDINRPIATSDGGTETLEWADALDRLCELIQTQSPIVVASANLTNESLFLVKSLCVEALGLEVVVPVEHRFPRKVKNGRGLWQRSASDCANATGAHLLGLKTIDASELEQIVRSGKILLLDNRATGWLGTRNAARALGRNTVAAIGRRNTPASSATPLVLPASSWLETEGTFTSSTGRVQLANKGLESLFPSLPNWRILSELGRRLQAPGCSFSEPREVFEEIVGTVPAFAGMTYRRLRTEPGTPAIMEVAGEF